MKRLVQYIPGLVLVIAMFAFQSYPSLKETAISVSVLKTIWSYRAVFIFIAILMIIIWKVLQIIPQRQARALYKPESPILIGEQKVNVEGFTVTPQTAITPMELFSIENEARKTLSQIIGGFIVIIGLLLTGANLAITSRLTQEGQITERFTKAIEQLADKKLTVQLGGLYALERIAKDSEKDHWTIMDVLTAYVREKAPRELQDHSQKPSGKVSSLPKTTADIRAILTVIGRRTVMVEEKRSIALRRTNLRGVELFKANLNGVLLREADLRGALILDSSLIETELAGADLTGGLFVGSDFNEADLNEADISGARLKWAHNLTWNQVSKTIIDDKTELPPEIENQHRGELKAMREKTRKEREGK